MKMLYALVLLALCGCASSNQQIKPISDFRYCVNNSVQMVWKYPGKYYTSIIYSCEPVIGVNKISKILIMNNPPQDAILIGGQMVTTTDTNTHPKDELYYIMNNHAKQLGANVLIEDKAAYTASPETHYYRAYYSARKRIDWIQKY